MNSDYTCKICGKVCKNSRALSAHIFNVHVEFRKNLNFWMFIKIQDFKVLNFLLYLILRFIK